MLCSTRASRRSSRGMCLEQTPITQVSYNKRSKCMRLRPLIFSYLVCQASCILRCAACANLGPALAQSASHCERLGQSLCRTPSLTCSLHACTTAQTDKCAGVNCGPNARRTMPGPGYYQCLCNSGFTGSASQDTAPIKCMVSGSLVGLLGPEKMILHGICWQFVEALRLAKSVSRSLPLPMMFTIGP